MRIPVLLLTALVVLLLLNLGKAFEGHDEVHDHASVKAVAHAGHEASTADEKVIERRFEVSPGQQLALNVSHADVEILTGSADEAHVVVYLEGRNMDRAREYFEDLRFTVEQEGDRIVVRTDRRRRANWSFDHKLGVRVRAVITVPERFDADLSVAHGDLKMASLEGAFDLNMAHGDARLAALRGENLSVTLAHGDLDADRLEGREISVRSAHGDVSMGEVISQRFNARFAHGDLKIDTLEGEAELVDAHGDIDLGIAKSNGLSIRNSHGDVTLRVPTDMPGNLRLSGDEVRIASSFRFEGTVRDNRADGRLNGGGPLLEASASHGSITVRSH